MSDQTSKREGSNEVGSGEATVSISAAPDAVWALAGDFGGLDGWMPGVDSCRLEGDIRVLSVLGMEISEKLVRRDDAERILEYSIIESPLAAEHHLGRVQVHDEGAGSRVTWYVEVTPDQLTDLLLGTYQQALDTLKSHLEGPSA
jgi:Polyketide cyclase / dehydrase and lipid transport